MFFAKRFSKDAVFLLGTGLLFFFLRFPSLYEPYWYGDEGIYFTIGRALRAGRELYTGIWDNKPPLLYWLYALCNDLFSIRFLSLLFGIASVYAFFLLSRKLFPGKYTAYITTIVFSLFLALPTIEGNIANAENFMLFPIIAAAVLFWQAGEKTIRNKRQLFFVAGLLLGIAFLLKTVALFDFIAFFLFAVFLATEKQRQLRHVLKNVLPSLIPYLAGFLLPIFLICLFFLVKGILPEFLSSIFLRNVSYVGEKNGLIIPQGYLILKFLLLSFALGILFRLKEKLTAQSLFILLWTALSLFNAYFSQRPYVHYQLVLLPALSLFLGLILTTVSLKKQGILAALLIGIVSLLYVTFPHWNTNKVLPYYGNFLAYLSGHKSVTDYRAYFDRNTPRDYALADFLKLHTHTNEEVLLWGDSAQIYYLSQTLPAGRYAVSYHITGDKPVAETQELLRTHPPKLLLILPGTQPLPFTISGYVYTLSIADTAIYERHH